MIINLTEPQRQILVHVLNQVESSLEYDPGSQMFDAKHFVLECDQKEHGELRALVERVRLQGKEQAREEQAIPSMNERALSALRESCEKGISPISLNNLEMKQLIKRIDNAENELALSREYTGKLQAELKAVNWKLEAAEKRNRGRSGGLAR